MCEWGIKAAQVKLARPKLDGRVFAPVDPCLEPLVQALNDAEILTVASCCGHGKRPGNIILEDGRELIIAPDWETARIVDKAFPPIQ
jgi:hypothetical protein